MPEASGHYQGGKQLLLVALQDTSTRSLHWSTSMKESAGNMYSFRNSPCPWHRHTQRYVNRDGGILQIILLVLPDLYWKMQSYENRFHFANLLQESLKMICSHSNPKVSPAPTGYTAQMRLVFAWTKFEALAQPAQKECPSILFSIPQRKES